MIICIPSFDSGEQFRSVVTMCNVESGGKSLYILLSWNNGIKIVCS